MTQGTLHPGLLPQLLGELHLGRKSGFLRLAKGEETVDLDLNEGGILRVCAIRGRDSLIEAFSWDGGKYVFLEGPAASPDDDQALDLGLQLVLRDGLGNGAADAVTQVLGDLDCVLVLEDGDRRALVCTPMDNIILGSVDGTRSIRKIIEQAPLPAEETERSLAVLLCTGVVQARRALLAVEAALEPNAPEDAPASQAVVFDAVEAAEPGEAAGAAEPAKAAEAAETAEPARAAEAAKAAETATAAEAAEAADAAEPAVAAEAAEAAVEPNAPEVSVAAAPPAPPPAPAAVLEVEGEAAVEPNAPETAPALLAVALEEVVEEALKAVEAAEAAVQPNRPQSPAPSALSSPTAPPPAASVHEAQAQQTVARPRRDSGDLQERLDDRVLLEVLGIGKGEMPVDLMDNALVADDVIRRATNMMAGSDPFGAIRLLEAVIPRIYVKELKREAQVVLAKGYTRNPKWVRRGEEMLQSVIREDPSFVDAYLALGTLYKENGLRARAVNMFRKVLELRPDHNLAAAEVRALIAPAPSKKLFGRT